MKKLLFLSYFLPAVLFGMNDDAKNSVGQEAEQAEAVLAVFIQRYANSNTTLEHAVMSRAFDEHVYETQTSELRDIRMAVCNFLTATPPAYRRICDHAHNLLSEIRLAEVALPSLLAAHLAEVETHDDH